MLIVRILVAFWAINLATLASAAIYPMPPAGSNMIGKVQVVTITKPKTTLLDIARHFDIGQDEIVAANPDVSPWVPKVGAKVIVPTEFILPPGPREGIVVNIPQRRLFYFIKKTRDQPAQVITYPVSISRPGWDTPLGLTRIVGKHKDPAWFVPKSVRAEHQKDGEKDFPTYFPPGPDNPMGMLALQTGFSQIFIHGTNQPWGVGMRMSHGCLHLYPEDAADLFPKIKVGTPVRMIDEPHTVGVRDGVVYLSSTEPIEEYKTNLSSIDRAAAVLEPYSSSDSDECPDDEIDWKRVTEATKENRFMPVPVSVDASELEKMMASIKAEPYTAELYGDGANNGIPPIRKSAEPNQKSGQKPVAKDDRGRTKAKLTADRL